MDDEHTKIPWLSPTKIARLSIAAGLVIVGARQIADGEVGDANNTLESAAVLTTATSATAATVGTFQMAAVTGPALNGWHGDQDILGRFYLTHAELIERQLSEGVTGNGYFDLS